MSGKVTRLSSQLDQIDRDESLPFSLLHADDDITLILYQPHSEDLQQPHDQDEYYFVASGSARIRIEDEVSDIGIGDAIYVPALASHHFEQPSEDFSCWALFYGPRKDAGGRADG